MRQRVGKVAGDTELERIWLTGRGVDDIEFAKIVASKLARWRHWCGCSHIDIELTILDDADAEDAAQVEVEPEYHVARIWVNRSVDHDWLDTYLRHEMLHIAIAELQEFARRHADVQYASPQRPGPHRGTAHFRATDAESTRPRRMLRPCRLARSTSCFSTTT